MSLRFTASLLIATAALSLSGCVNLAPRADERRFYTLATPRAGVVEQSTAAKQVEVRLSRTADYLQSTRMAVRRSEVELQFSDDHRWAEPVNDSLARLIASTLRDSLSEGVNVRVVPIRTVGADVTSVDLVLSACEGHVNGTAIVEIDWQIWQGTTGRPAASGVFRETATGWDVGDYGQLALLLTRLGEDFARTLADSLATFLTPAND